MTTFINVGTLAEEKRVQIIRVGTLTFSGNASSINIAGAYPKFRELTINNIVPVNVRCATSAPNRTSVMAVTSVTSYDANSGTIYFGRQESGYNRSLGSDDCTVAIYIAVIV